jgi:hypothetical protein
MALSNKKKACNRAARAARSNELITTGQQTTDRQADLSREDKSLAGFLLQLFSMGKLKDEHK